MFTSLTDGREPLEASRYRVDGGSLRGGDKLEGDVVILRVCRGQEKRQLDALPAIDGPGLFNTGRQVPLENPDESVGDGRKRRLAVVAGSELDPVVAFLAEGRGPGDTAARRVDGEAFRSILNRVGDVVVVRILRDELEADLGAFPGDNGSDRLDCGRAVDPRAFFQFGRAQRGRGRPPEEEEVQQVDGIGDIHSVS